MNLATRWIDRGAVAFNVPTAFGAGSFPGGSERAPRALVEGHLRGRFVQRAKVSRAEAGLRARSVGERARESAWGPPNNELQLTSGTCCGRVEPLRGTTRWLS